MQVSSGLSMIPRHQSSISSSARPVATSTKILNGPKEEAMRVVLRCRPPTAKEAERGDGCGFSIISKTVAELQSQRPGQGAQRYKLDACYGPNSSQSDIFDVEIKSQLKRLLQGQNTSVLAYGPTGAGKTFTMVGDTRNPGIIPRSMEKIFQLMKRNEQHANFSTHVSTFEIYNEEVFDLFNVGMKGLPVRQDDKGQVHVPGLTKRKISNFADFNKLYEGAMNNRKVAPTLLNQASSRSHFLLVLEVDRQERSSGKIYTGKLTFVDLAGSEDNRRTGNMGARMMESGHINKSLLALNNLVTQLNKKEYPNYRQSCLTRMLKDCLGGNSYSCLFANVAQNSYHDTFSTLNFAKKGMKIMCKPVVAETNPNMHDKENVPPPSRKRERLSDGLTTTSGKRVALGTLGGNAHEIERSNQMNGVTAKRLMEKGDKLMSIMKTNQALAFYQRAQLIQPGCRELTRKIREAKQEIKANEVENGAASDEDYDPEDDTNNNDDSFIEEITRKRPKPLTSGTTDKRIQSVTEKKARKLSCDSQGNISMDNADFNGTIGESSGIALKLDRELVNMLEERLLQSLNAYPVKRLCKELKGVGPKRAELIVDERSQGNYSSLEDCKKRLKLSDKVFSSLVKENVTNFISLVH
eukprot:CFRG1853T1